jgi:cytochrome c oxidase subunit 4
MHDPAAHKKTYFTIFGILLVLTAVTIGVAFIDLGPLNTLVALSIASFKAVLVALFFMHLAESKPLTQLFSLAAVGWLVILLVLTLCEYLSRQWSLYS